METVPSFASPEEIFGTARFNLVATPESEILEDTIKCRKAQKLNSRSPFEDANRSGRPNLASSRSMPRSASVLSLASLDIQMQESDEQMNIARPISVLRDVLSGETRNVRLSSLMHLVIISCLLFGTLSDIIFRIRAESGGGSNYADKKNKVYDNEKKGILGSAMIESLSDALLPILPFAGGVDLRRDDAWKSWRNYLWLFGDGDPSRTKVNKIGKNTLLIPRGGAVQEKKINSSLSTAMVLSTAESFLPLEDIADMTLREISFTFHYVLESGKEEFDAESFITKDFEGEPVNARMVKAVRFIEDATQKSRGKGILSALTSINYELSDGGVVDRPLSDAGYGDIDALSFCASMRILAEWRGLRQVPPGYKGYAVGMSLGQKDVVQNIVKIEHAAHMWIESSVLDQLEQSKKSPQRSPTLRQLLADEIDGDVHPNNRLPRLKEKTAAMGLLWVRRQLNYQTAIFDNILSVPKVFPTVIDAVGAAYTEVYGSLHGWAVQKIFNYSFQSAPNAKEIFRHMNPRLLDELKNKAISSSPASPCSDMDVDTNEVTPVTVVTTVTDGTECHSSKGFLLKSHRKGGTHVLDFLTNIGLDFDKFGHHLGGEWDKVVCKVSNIFDQKEQKDCKNTLVSLKTRGGSSKTSNTLSDEDIEEFTSEEIQRDAKAHISVFIKVVSPMLNDLAGLFDEMNMDDPTKV